MARLRVLEIEGLAHLQEAELAVCREPRRRLVADARAHGRREALDVEAHLAPRLHAVRVAVLAHPEDPLQGHRARSVEVGEADAELTAVAHVVPPHDLAGSDDAHALA